jgi:hypothetical protein
MPHLDAKALEIDPQGMAFLRDVLKPARTPAAKPEAGKPRLGAGRGVHARVYPSASCSPPETER